MQSFLRPVYLLCLAAPLLLGAMTSTASEQAVTEAIKTTDKATAWNNLYKLARSGNVEAMFAMAQLLETSPEIADGEEKALAYYQAAADRGHAEALSILNQKKRRDAEIERGPTKAQIQEAIRLNEQRYLEMKNAASGTFIRPDGTTAKYKVDVFFKESSPALQQIIDLSNRSRRKDTIWNFYLVMDSSMIGNTNHLFQLMTAPPKEGFIPDIDGEEANSLGIRSYPAISVSDSSGHRLVDLNFLTAHFEQ